MKKIIVILYIFIFGFPVLMQGAAPFASEPTKTPIKQSKWGTVQYGDLYYEIEEANNAIVTFDKSNQYSNLTDVKIPAEIEYAGNKFPVVAVGSRAFANASTVKSISIPDCVTRLESDAFNRAGITSINLGNGVTEIGESAFAYTKLKEIILPECLVSIGSYAFANNTDLKSINIPNSVVTIGKYTFSMCTNLKNITIGKSASSLGIGIFEECAGLESIDISSENPNFTAVDGIIYTKDAKTLIMGNGGLSGTIMINPSTTSIDAWAFAECRNITEIILPDSLLEIGDKAFIFCTNLANIVFGENLEYIGKSAFNGCSSLQTLSFNKNLKTIDEKAFQDCASLISVEFTSTEQLSLNGECFWNDENIEAVYCNCPQPPVLGHEVTASIFSSAVYKNATLYSSIQDFYYYYTTLPWSNFSYRDIMENVGVDTIPDSTGSGPLTVYSLDGKPVQIIESADHLKSLPSGIYIIGGKKILIP